jgi:hypothetical protein
VHSTGAMLYAVVCPQPLKIHSFGLFRQLPPPPCTFRLSPWVCTHPQFPNAYSE